MTKAAAPPKRKIGAPAPPPRLPCDPPEQVCVLRAESVRAGVVALEDLLNGRGGKAVVDATALLRLLQGSLGRSWSVMRRDLRGEVNTLSLTAEIVLIK